MALQGLPTGTVTFLFTDVEGSTSLLQRLGDAYAGVLEEHAGIIRTAVDAAGGIVVSTEGDGFFCAFETASQGVQAAVAAQRDLRVHTWEHEGGVWVRMGLHTGEGVLGGDNYVGLDVHRAARIASAAHGGQVLVSDATRSLAEDSLPSDARFRDLDVHRLKDLQRPERLHELLIEGLEQGFPPPRTLEGVEGSLPAQLTSFVGRESEIAEVARLLSRALLVTLTGTGGVGKTRLAVRVADAVRERFPDGVWFVPLEEIADPSLLVGAVVEELDLRHMSGDAYAQLVQHLRGQRILLLLDNFEHLLPDGVNAVSDLLRDCPDLRVLVTSRAPLHVTGEQEMRVPPLAGPDVERAGPDSDIRDRPAVQLFVERADAVRPDFELTADNASAVATITRRLDGLPLAIELAAALVNVLSPQAILDRLEGRLDILSGGPQDRPERQRSLRAAIQWSYELLHADDRRLLEELGVFVGGASLPMIERVCSVGGDVRALLEGLRALLDQSLLTRHDVDDEPRFLMVATIREFALEQLEARGDHDATRRRHAEAVRELAAEADDGMRGPEEGRWVAVIDREFANLRAAVTWALSAGDVDLALPTVVSLNRYAINYQLREEVARWAEDALELPGARSHPLFAPACGVAAWGRLIQGGLARSSELAERGMSAVDDPDDPARAYPLIALATVARIEGRLDDAVRYAREAEPITDIADREQILGVQALALTYGGDPDSGIEVALRQRNEAERARIPSAIAWSYYYEGEALVQRDPDRALALFEEATVLAETVGARSAAEVAQLSATSLRARRGDPRRSLKHFRDLIESWRVAGAGGRLWTAMRSVAQVFARVGSLEVAAVLHTAVMRDDLGPQVYGEDAERLSTLADELEDQLSTAQLERATARGRLLSEDEVIDLALAEIDQLLDGET